MTAHVKVCGCRPHVSKMPYREVATWLHLVSQNAISDRMLGGVRQMNGTGGREFSGERGCMAVGLSYMMTRRPEGFAGHGRGSAKSGRT
jgi:hypothetical protein